MARELKLAGLYDITERQLADSKFYTLMLADYQSLSELPVPEGTSQAAVASYLHYLTKRDQATETLRQSLRFAHLIEDSGYLQHLITDMLAGWTASGYRQLLETLSEELLSDICMRLPYLQLPAKLQRDYSFLHRWMEAVQDKKFIVDGAVWSHDFGGKLGRLEYLFCQREGDGTSFTHSVHWYPGTGTIQRICSQPSLDEEETERFSPSGILTIKSSMKDARGARKQEFWVYYPSGKPQCYTKREHDRELYRIEWTEDGRSQAEV